MNYRDIRTDQQAKRIAQEINITLSQGNGGICVAGGYWANRAVCAVREYLMDAHEHSTS
jgi:hypothetical protein